ncbi:MAG: CHAT domain-containing protein [Saprospiraceae bacterium]|nr:CHAT domain-containing protein [Saprospiraceae bacterium]MCF8250779.1 CHAT domain-containing protein [Saprospiraceae bacterium]MCF8281757.1 CHAT domain-containing protein [Bacteroidales bacterium]MCF8312580.1 CHAT domain-containing protein [Saprospiraceae bacterium]MCF8440909.1 CHAT domain-containing protein [Saprospiraceae bacterium]
MKHNLIAFLFLLPFFSMAQPADSIAIRQVDSLVQVSRSLTNQRQYKEAQKINDIAESAALMKLGKDSPTYASCLFNHGRIFQAQRELEDAVPFYLAAIKIQETATGADPGQLAASLNNLGIIYRNQGQLEETEQIYLKVKAIREKVFTRAHPDYAAILTNLGSLYTFMFRFREAESNLLEAKGLWENDLEMDSARYAEVLDNLADVYYKTGRYEEAEPLYLNVKNIREKIYGVHPEYGRILNDLATLYSDMARFEEAERWYLRGMEVQEATIGKESSDYAWSLSNLGLLYKDMGRYEDAERSLLEARQIWEKMTGPKSPEYGTCLDNLASLYYKLGLFEAAEPLYKEALDIRRKEDEKGMEFSVSLNNLAVLYMAKEDYKEAEPFYKLSKTNIEKTTGKENATYAWTLNNLGILYDKMGRYATADSLLSEARIVRKKILGKNHPDYANTLEDLASLYQKIKNPEAALKLHLEAKAIFEKTFDKSHPRYEECIRNLAVLYQEQGNHELAGPLMLEANDLQRSLLVKSTRYLSERELAANAITFASGLDGLYSFARQKPAINFKLSSVLFDNTIFHKGFLLTASNQVKHLALRDSASSMRYELLTSYHRRLAAEYAKPIEERAGVATLEQKANELEKELVRTVSGFGEATKQVTWQEVQSKLQPGEAVVEFVHYQYRTPESTDSVFYSALVLQPGDATPKFVHLCEEKSLDSLFGAGTARRSDFVADLYNYHERGATPLGKPNKSLYELLWQPLEGELKSVKTIYFSPSGLIHRLNLGAIALNKKESLAERYKLIQLISTRQLVVPCEVKILNQEALVFGAVKYELDTAIIQSQPVGITEEALASRNRASKGLSLTYTDSTARGGPLGFLEYTEEEIAYVELSLKVGGIQTTVRKGYEATEEAFKTTGMVNHSPRVIHIATHGYFFPDPKESGNRLQLAPTKVGGSEPVFKISDNPMLRSGLILSGGNYAWETGKPLRPNMEDGILTAYEICQMNLSNTELVVLSACETGLGDIKGNEGVYGLQRAIKIAGAKYLIMSLWQVPDKQTSLLMKAFYEKWLEDKMSVKDALLAAQKARRDNGDDPFYWAGFVLVE